MTDLGHESRGSGSVGDALARPVSRRSFLKLAAAAGAAAGATSLLGLTTAAAAPARVGAEAPRFAPLKAGGTLTFVWIDWVPSRLLESLGSEYEKVSGWKVVGDYVGATQWHDKIFTEFAAQTGADIPIGDSQWIGEESVGGHIMELTDWAAKNLNLNDINPASLKSYGEFPDGSGRLWGLPCEGDCLTYVYRKDLFSDPNEQANFKAKYGRDLAPATTWDEYYDIAEFFHRPDQGLYGSAMHFAAAYDAITCNFNQIFWSNGGELWDGHNKVVGYLNSDAGVAALDYLKKLYKISPPGSGNWWFNEVNEAMAQGQVAQSINWIAFHPGLVDPNSSKVGDKIGFAVAPGTSKAHFVCLGGQGLQVSNYSKNKDAVLDFVKWFWTEETQTKWAKGGGLTAHLKVLNSPEFDTYFPWNNVFKQTLPLLRDFWHVPEYAKMLELQEQTLNSAVVNDTDTKEALDKIAQGQQDILMAAYPS